MIITDDICYANIENESIRVLEATPINSEALHLVFSNGEKKLFNRNKLTGSVYEPLQNASVFCNTEIIHSVVTWMNGEIDCAPEYMYINEEPCE